MKRITNKLKIKSIQKYLQFFNVSPKGKYSQVIDALRDAILQKYKRVSFHQLAKDLKITCNDAYNLVVKIKLPYEAYQNCVSNQLLYLYNKISKQTYAFISDNQQRIIVPDVRLGITYCPTIWSSSIFKEKDYYEYETLGFTMVGFQMFTIFEHDNMRVWNSLINEKLGLNKKIDETKCLIADVSPVYCKKFLKANHINGYEKAEINIGLVDNTAFGYYKLVQLMTFRGSKLIRLCNINNYSISYKRLFNYYIKMYNIKKLTAMCDLRYSDGKEYEELGFKLIKRIPAKPIKYGKYTVYDCGHLLYEYTQC